MAVTALFENNSIDKNFEGKKVIKIQNKYICNIWKNRNSDYGKYTTLCVPIDMPGEEGVLTDTDHQ